MKRTNVWYMAPYSEFTLANPTHWLPLQGRPTKKDAK
jgi:hypothetical protein